MEKVNLNKYGYIRTGVAVPTLRVGDPDFNAREIAKQVLKAYSNHVEVLVFPELSLTGYTCADLFNQRSFEMELKKAWKSYFLIHLDMMSLSQWVCQ